MAKPAFVPTDEQKRQVQSMAGYGIPHDDIALAVGIDGIDAKTLRKYFRAELDKGMALAKVNVGKSMYDLAVGRPAQYHPETGVLLKEELKPDKTAAIFLSKVRLGFTETSRVEHSGPNGGPIQTVDLDLSVFTDEEFKLFMQLYEKARRRRDNEGGEGGAPAAPGKA